MFDLHCHILPGLDDGANDLASSLQMLDIAVRSNTNAIAATPHIIEGKQLTRWEHIVESCRQLSDKATEKKLCISIYPGAEVAIGSDILDIVRGPGPYCINGSRYMLIELPALEIPHYTEDFFFSLKTRGIEPILAHPERHPVLIRQSELLVKWVNNGILTQVNGSSLTGSMGARVKAAAELFLKNNLVHFIGSDAHGVQARTPDLTQAVTRLSSLIDKEQLEYILVNNPSCVIGDREISVTAPKNIELPRKQKSIMQYLSKWI